MRRAGGLGPGARSTAAQAVRTLSLLDLKRRGLDPYSRFMKPDLTLGFRAQELRGAREMSSAHSQCGSRWGRLASLAAASALTVGWRPLGTAEPARGERRVGCVGRHGAQKAGGTHWSCAEENPWTVSQVGIFKKPVPIKNWPRQPWANHLTRLQAGAVTLGGWACTEEG